jgi:hypothetical protein
VSKNGEVSIEDLTTEEKLDLLIEGQVELGEKLDELLERLLDLGRFGSDFSIDSFEDE